jgi:hypothetical protein
MQSYNNNLSQDETYQLTQRFPSFELSYETIPHKKVSSAYNLCLAIPQGKKGYLWFTYYGEADVCFFMELNRDKKVARMRIVDFEYDKGLCLGTVLYGSLVEITKSTGEEQIPIFVIEDIFLHKGISLKSMLFGERLSFIDQIIQKYFTNKLSDNKSTPDLLLSLPPLWPIEKPTEYECVYEIPEVWRPQLTEFQIHHIQYRALYEKGPYMNVFNNNSILHKKPPTYIPIQTSIFSSHRMDSSKAQYRLPTVFLVTADIQFDIYHLFTYGKASQQVYYNVAYIPSYECSKMMNGIFRKIKENTSLDAIEESDDEEDFEDIREDKYVDLQKTVQMECIYSPKFKKWVPKRVVQGQKIIHISLL